MQIADLHVHSKYAAACSDKLTIENMASAAKWKGIDILGTGDFLHPIWNKEIRSKLKTSSEGIYEHDGTKFILSGEVSLIYKQGGKTRKVHHVMLCPDLEILTQIQEYFMSKGRVDYDGRPIFGLTSIEVVESLMSISKDIMMIPAHVWTPWFAIFGSMSGFDSVEECFGEKSKYIHALETGLSSDPAMNWRVPSLDKYSLVSFSDAHSLPKLAREFTAFDLKELTFKNLTNAIKTKNPKEFLFTGEVPPAFGKYHWDGHRKCGVVMSPKESIKHKKICPKCGDPLIIGVEYRIEELAKREDGFVPNGAIPFKSLIPLDDLVAAVKGTKTTSKKTKTMFECLLRQFGTEFNILLNTPYEELKKVNEKLADAIVLNREGKIKVMPGYDGVYGMPILGPATRSNVKEVFVKKKQKGLSDFTK